MSIPLAIQSEVPKWVFSMSSKLRAMPPEKALSLCVFVEGTFYSSLKSTSSNSFKIINSIRQISISYINEIQIAFNLLNIGSALFYAKKIAEKTERSQFTFIDPLTTQSIVGYVFPLAITGTVYALGTFLLKCFSKPSSYEKNGIEISEAPSFQKKLAQRLHLTQLVLNIALACLTKNRFWLVLNVMGSGYNYIKNSQLKWLNFSRTFKFVSQQQSRPSTLNLNQLHLPPPKPSGVKEAKITYHLLALSSQSSSDDCSICLEAGPDTSFCAHHIFHKDCLIDLAAGRSQLFANATTYKRIDTAHYTNSVYTGTTRAYCVTIPQTNLLSCPNCREIPRQNNCSVLVSDHEYGDFNATVTIGAPNSSFNQQLIFEKFYAAYNFAQAGLTYLQQYPELAASVFKVQKFLLITDLMGLACNYYFLYQNIIKKFNLENRKAKVVIAVSVVALTALSYLIILKVNTVLKPAILLKDVLSSLPISPEILQGISISWNSPPIHKLMQYVFINRIAASFALAFFSSNPLFSLLSGSSQLLSLAGISTLRWIEVVQDLTFPLPKIVAEGGKLSSHLSQKSLKSLKATSHFMTYPFCSNEPFHLKSTVNSIYECVTKMFRHSLWNRYWNIKVTNGVETSRSLYYEITLQNSSLDPCGCTLQPYLESIALEAVDATYGLANTKLLYAN